MEKNTSKQSLKQNVMVARYCVMLYKINIVNQ